MILLVVVASETEVRGGRKWGWKSPDCLVAVGAVTSTTARDDERTEGYESRMMVALRRAMGGRRWP